MIEKEINIIKELLITEKNKEILQKKENKDWNIKKLLGREDLNQSQSIIFGKQIFEKLIKDIAEKYNSKISNKLILDIYDTGNSNQKGKKEMDIYFEYNDVNYYFECKTNLNLDSEKSKATDKKVGDIFDYLRKTETKPVDGGVLSCWYEKENKLPIKVKNVFYMKDFFRIFNLDISKDEYYNIFLDFGKTI